MNRGFGTGFAISILLFTAVSPTAWAIPGGLKTSAYPFVRELLIFPGASPTGELRTQDATSSCTASFLSERTLVTDAHCVCDPTAELGVLDPTSGRVVRVSRREYLYDFPKRALSNMSGHCESWNGPALDGTDQDIYDGTDADLGVTELEHSLERALGENEYPLLPGRPVEPGESVAGEYAFVGYGYGEAGWANGGFRFLGEKSIRRVARVHVKSEQDSDFGGEPGRFRTLLFPGVYLRVRGAEGVDRLVPRGGGGHDLMTAPGDSGGPLLRDGVIWAVVSSFGASVARLHDGSNGEPEVFGVKNYAMSLGSPFVFQFFEELHAKGYVFSRASSR